MLSLDQIADAFRKEIDQQEDSEAKVIRIIEFTNNYFDTVGNRCLPFLEEAQAICKRIEYKAGEVLCLCNGLFARYISNNITNTDAEIQRIGSMLEAIKDRPFEYSYSLTLFGYLHWYRGEFDKGFNNAFAALKVYDQVTHIKESGWMFYSLGVFYFDTNDLTNAEHYFEKSIASFEGNNYTYGSARAKNGLASVKIKQLRNEEAIPYLEFAINTYRDGNFYSGLARTLTDLALIQKAEKNYSRALELLEESLAIRKTIQNAQGLITSYTEIGELLLIRGEVELALQNLLAGIKISETIGAKYKSMRLHKLLSDTFKQAGNIHLAFEHFEKFHNLKSDVLSEESANNIRKMQTKFETEKSEKEAEIERLKNVELRNANLIISEKQKEILDSIHYAKRIQLSLLPTEKYIERQLKRLQKK